MSVTDVHLMCSGLTIKVIFESWAPLVCILSLEPPLLMKAVLAIYSAMHSYLCISYHCVSLSYVSAYISIMPVSLTVLIYCRVHMDHRSLLCFCAVCALSCICV